MKGILQFCFLKAPAAMVVVIVAFILSYQCYAPLKMLYDPFTPDLALVRWWAGATTDIILGLTSILLYGGLRRAVHFFRKPAPEALAQEALRRGTGWQPSGVRGKP